MSDDDDARLSQQRDANEQLVLALLRETTRADDAEQAERDLRETAEFRERLIGIVGHDLRNPLNSVLMAAGFLLSKGNLAPAEADVAKRILDSSRRMKRIIAQILGFTRARLGGGFTLDPSRTDLGDVARRIATELRMGTGCEIEVEASGDVTGSWDTALLGEVLSNIAGNAVEHAAPGTPVAITLGDRGASVFASIANQGETIPPEVRDHIFDPFRRADTEQKSQGNLGLGLYIASAIVSAHAGHIDVVSENGATTFTVVLPREPPPR